MIKTKINLRSENISKIRAFVNGLPARLQPISTIELKIPTLGWELIDSIPGEYPVKWEFDPEDPGLIELKLGMVQSLIDKFIITTTGNFTSGSKEITNVPVEIIKQINKRYRIESPFYDGGSTEIRRIRRGTNTVITEDEANSSGTGQTFKVFQYFRSSLHVCEFYIYNVDIPDGEHWSSIKLDIRL